MATLKEELNDLSWGWKLIILVGGILLIQALFELTFDIGITL